MLCKTIAMLSIFTATLLLACVSTQQLSSSLDQIRDFGPNPRNVSMYIYVPKNLPSNPPILVVPHWCHGTAQDAFKGRPYASLGDQHGFISIYPDSPNKADQCWDVSSNASLTHDGEGGTSSGAMMTQVLLGSYPDVFAAGSAWAGVPFGCFAGDGYGVWSDACATGKIIKNGSEWAAMVQKAYLGYTGYRPKVQVLHGTVDTVLNPQNLKEEIKQWTSVLKLSETPTETTNDTPLKGWTRRRFGASFEAYEAAGVDHNISNQADTVMDFFDLRCNNTSGRACFSRVSH
jgi:acetylxylan esterase